MPVSKPSKEEIEYWEKVLHDHHLQMGRGKREWLLYGAEYRDTDARQVPTEDDYSEESSA